MYVIGIIVFFFQAEDGIRDLVRSRGLGDVYKRQDEYSTHHSAGQAERRGANVGRRGSQPDGEREQAQGCLLYTSDAADERSSVDLGGRRIIKKKTRESITEARTTKKEKRTTREQ